MINTVYIAVSKQKDQILVTQEKILDILFNIICYMFSKIIPTYKIQITKNICVF